MSFSDLFKRLIIRNPLRKNRHHKRVFESAPKDETLAVRSKTITEIKAAEENEEAIRQKPITIAPQKNVTRQNALLLVVYQDLQGNLLSPSQIISGTLGEKLRLQFKKLTDYNLVRIKGFTSYFASHYGIITLTYSKKDAGVIWVICRDIDTNFFLTDPQLVKGKVKEPFQLFSPSLPGYNLLRVSGKLRGNFSYDQSFVTFYYRHSSWKDVKKTETYLRILAPISSYEKPQGEQINISFALNTVWRTFSSITLNTGELWYCLGGTIWVKFDSKKMAYSNKMEDFSMLSPKAVAQVKRFKNSKEALIDFIPNKDIGVYDSPFGQKVGALKDGTKVSITAKTLNDDVVWFKLVQDVWIPRQYLKF
ncbi:MucBP domain-containing protein [Liquorilactobacillus aquaticus]|uniref:MucBP domain-containing protein n=1 Tax=Liquorilactobacillus aquaticus TaxID=392566 RepID=UPI00070C2A93|nr:MucBP domain-containing protein [Liquorilactobacillus aquaticus]